MRGVTGRDRRRVQLIAAVMAGDVVFDATARTWVRDDLDRLKVPHSAIPVILSAKAASVAGLLVGLHRRPLGSVTSACLVGYFVLAVGAHARVRDEAWRYGPAIAMLVASARIYRVFRDAGTTTG